MLSRVKRLTAQPSYPSPTYSHIRISASYCVQTVALEQAPGISGRARSVASAWSDQRWIIARSGRSSGTRSRRVAKWARDIQRDADSAGIRAGTRGAPRLSQPRSSTARSLAHSPPSRPTSPGAARRNPRPRRSCKQLGSPSSRTDRPRCDRVALIRDHWRRACRNDTACGPTAKTRCGEWAGLGTMALLAVPIPVCIPHFPLRPIWP